VKLRLIFVQKAVKKVLQHFSSAPSRPRQKNFLLVIGQNESQTDAVFAGANGFDWTAMTRSAVSSASGDCRSSSARFLMPALFSQQVHSGQLISRMLWRTGAEPVQKYRLTATKVPLRLRRSREKNLSHQ